MKENIGVLQHLLAARSWLLALNKIIFISITLPLCCGTGAVLQQAGLSVLTPAAPLSFATVWCSAVRPLCMCDARSKPAEISPQAETKVCCSSGCSELEKGRLRINAERCCGRNGTLRGTGLVSVSAADLC